jgi:DtxR family Mn-dependent transcriptional regulator/ferrous iron transport protein A
MNVPLHRLRPGQSARVVELQSTDPDRLERLNAFGLSPGTWIRVGQVHPVVIFSIGETELSIDREVASEILVAP